MTGETLQRRQLPYIHTDSVWRTGLISQKTPRASLIQLPWKYVRTPSIHCVLIAAVFGFAKEKQM